MQKLYNHWLLNGEIMKYLILVFTIYLLTVTLCYSQQDSIIVDVSQKLGVVNRDILGSHIVTPYCGAFEDLSSEIFLDRMEEAGFTMLRWPGGSNSCNYNWKIDGR